MMFPLTLPHLNVTKLLPQIISPSLVHFPLSMSFYNIFFSQSLLNFLTIQELTEAPKSYKNCATVSAESVNSKSVNFPLCSRYVKTFNFTFWACELWKKAITIFSEDRVLLDLDLKRCKSAMNSQPV